MDMDAFRLDLEYIYNLTGIAHFVITALSLFIALISYLFSRKSLKKNKAAELAKYYIDNILPKIDYISKVFNSSKLGALLREIFKPDEILVFDYNEMISFLKDKYTEDDIMNKINSIDPEHLIKVRLSAAKSSMERNEIISSCVLIKGTEDSAATIERNYLINDFTKLIMELLNELEWFSLHFTYKLADEKIVYQSLHQTFISNVQTLYFFISRINKSPSEKYYTNVIHLYRSWYDCKVRQQKKQRELEKKLIRRGKPL